VQKDPTLKRDRPEPQRLARDATDPERATLTELRRQHGRDLAAWPPEDRERYERWRGGRARAAVLVEVTRPLVDTGTTRC
jgi:hypothetical protein